MRTLTTWLLLAFAATVAVGAATGWRPVVLLSGSMAPGAPAGSLLLTRETPGERVAVGDVVVAHPVGGERPVTHRVVELLDGGRLAVTKGDANDAPDPAPVPLTGDALPVARVTVPGVGRLLTASPAALTALVACVSCAVALLALWRPDRRGASRVAAPPAPGVTRRSATRTSLTRPRPPARRRSS